MEQNPHHAFADKIAAAEKLRADKEREEEGEKRRKEELEKRIEAMEETIRNLQSSLQGAPVKQQQQREPETSNGSGSGTRGVVLQKEDPGTKNTK